MAEIGRIIVYPPAVCERSTFQWSRACWMDGVFLWGIKTQSSSHCDKRSKQSKPLYCVMLWCINALNEFVFRGDPRAPISLTEHLRIGKK